MTGLVHSYESFGTVDGPGIRFVLFLQGCPMRCLYCHNPDTWTTAGGFEKTVEDVCGEILKYKRYYCPTGGVTVSGGEPLLQIDFLIELFTQLKAENIHTCVDTSGICFRKDDDRYLKLLAVSDLFLLDIKHIDENKHKALTGHSGAAPREFAEFLSDNGKKMWIRHVLVPKLTDGEGALRRLRQFIDGLKTVEKVEVLPYHTMGEVKYGKLGIKYPLCGVKPPSSERVEYARAVLNKNRTETKREKDNGGERGGNCF